MSALTRPVDVLLDRSSSDARLSDACRELYDVIRNATPAAREASEAADDCKLAEGLAISPFLASQCLLDPRRTAGFLRGVLAAIETIDASVDVAIETIDAAVDAAIETFRGPIEVVYAGTGPFAPLALLLMERLDLRRVHFTLIDVNQPSVDSVRSLLDHFGFAGPAVVCADATTYRHPRPIHVIVTETMQCALRTEPFVAITRNLVPQLAAGGVIVPEKVTVDLMLVDVQEPVGRNPRHLATIDVDRGTRVHVPASPAHGLALFTEIRVFGADTLRAHESGLTAPVILWPLSLVTRDVTLAFRYETGTNPGFRWS